MVTRCLHLAAKYARYYVLVRTCRKSPTRNSNHLHTQRTAIADFDVVAEADMRALLWGKVDGLVNPNDFEVGDVEITRNREHRFAFDAVD